MHGPDQAWDTIKRELDAAGSRIAQAARRQITNDLNQLIRRLRNYETEREWVSTVLEGVSRFVRQAAIFTLNKGALTLCGQHNLELAPDFSFPAASAGAFAAAIDGKDTVIALRTPAEVPEGLSSSEPGKRAHLIPILNAGRVAAVLFAVDQEEMDLNALEIVAGIASAVLERQSNTARQTRIERAYPLSRELSAPAATSKLEGKIGESSSAVSSNENRATTDTGAASRKPALPAWADLNEDQRNLHMRAQRFSRAAVANMQLFRPEACRAGREQANLYLFLKNEIDAARDAYRKQFLLIPSMIDYLHLELVGTAAEGDELKLGADYPGQLV